ncbi:Amidohydrolase 3 (fragment) [uncultured delta proteobacterium]|uniref:Amidohydrolase 3 n=1 Tax=uncultured delta proteobacterium TaxID=34034 RepID=A0A212KAA7_9DELT
MMHDILVKNGLVIDPLFGSAPVKRDIYIKDGVFAADGGGGKARRTIDAGGCYVSPGFIDAHGHYYKGGSELGGNADIISPPNCVTTVIDAGSAGI